MIKKGIFADKSSYTHHADIGFVISLILLMGLGLATLHASSASYGLRAFGDSAYFIKRQLIFCAIGLFFMGLSSIIDFEIMRKILPFIYVVTLILCVMTFLPHIGIERNGAKRWIRLPFLGSFQPSELAKFTVILFLANFFDKKQEKLKEPGLNIAQSIIGFFLVVFIVFLQDDFSTAFFIMIIGLSMFFIAGMKLTWFIGFCIFSLPIVILFIFTKTYRVERLIAFFNPDLYSHGLNFQIKKAAIAISSGGFFGEGFGSGLKKVASIPEVQSDFVFSGWAEAMGFTGIIIFLFIVFYFAYRGYVIAFRCQDKLRSYTAFGIVTCIIVQILSNCGVVCGALPSTGIPMPFFTSGGSSLIVTLFMCGIVINISKYDSEIAESKYE
ncbi:MAG: peptidoglycan glycosyltransferase FtsW [Treponemataceae bacterium]